MPSFAADPAETAPLVRFLRELADYLDQATDIPGPGFGACLILHATPADQGGRAQVDHIAALMDVEVHDDTDHDSHYWAARTFGRTRYDTIATTRPPSPAHPAVADA